MNFNTEGLIPFKDSKPLVIRQFLIEVTKQEKLKKNSLWKVYESMVSSELFNPTSLAHPDSLSWSYDYFYFPNITVKHSEVTSLASFRKSQLVQHFNLGLQYEDLNCHNLEFCMVFKLDKQFYIMARSNQSMSEDFVIYLQPDNENQELPYYICSMENFTPLIK